MIAGLPALAQDFLVQETKFALLASVQQVAQQDSTRWAIAFANATNSAGTAFVSTNQNLGLSQGFALVTQMPIVSLNYRDHGPLVQQAWYSFESGGLINLTVFEVFYRPRGLSTGMPTDLPDDGIQL